jgi:hypothetical protein
MIIIIFPAYGNVQFFTAGSNPTVGQSQATCYPYLQTPDKLYNKVSAECLATQISCTDAHQDKYCPQCQRLMACSFFKHKN